MATSYEINKGINRSIEFKGIKAQYIVYLALGLVGLLLAFSILYIIGVGLYICLGIVIPCGVALYITVQGFSHKYGEFGLIKKMASGRLPKYVVSKSRNCFIQLRENCHGEKGKKIGKCNSDL